MPKCRMPTECGFDAAAASWLINTDAFSMHALRRSAAKNAQPFSNTRFSHHWSRRRGIRGRHYKWAFVIAIYHKEMLLSL